MQVSRDGYQPRCKACSARYDAENAERISERKRLYYKAKKQKIIDSQAKYRAENKEKITKRMLAYYSENKDSYRARSRERRANNPEGVAANLRAARARKQNAEGSHNGLDIRAIFEAQRGMCANCQTKLFKSGKQKYHVDHIMPLARGGSNWPDNLQCLCPTCNLSKGAKHPVEWARENGRLI